MFFLFSEYSVFYFFAMDVLEGAVKKE